MRPAQILAQFAELIERGKDFGHFPTHYNRVTDFHMSLLLPQTDRELERRVRTALVSRRFATTDKLAITVTGSIVTLAGCVRSYYARQVLVHGCLRVPGVQGVIDEICVEK